MSLKPHEPTGETHAPGQPAALRDVGYGAAIFLSAAAGLVLEIVAGRMLAPYLGMSLYTWTAVIATVLAGLTVGHWIGGRMSETAHRNALRRVAAMLFAAAVATALCLPLVRGLAPLVLSWQAHPIVAVSALAALLFFLPTFFIGTISPILTKLAVDFAPEARGRAIGRMYALGAFGSIAGTLAAGYLFLSWIGVIGTVIAVAAVLALLGLGFAVAARRMGEAAAGGLAGAVVLVVAAATGALASPCTAESDYYCIRILNLDDASPDGPRVMVLDHMGHGINDPEEPTRLVSSYVALTDRLLDLRRPPGTAVEAFFIGGGAYTLPRAWQAGRPGSAIEVAEVDPEVTRLASERMWFAPGDHVDVRHRDARFRLQSLAASRRFDVVVGDAFHDISIPAHLTTAEFAREIRRHLAPDGIYTLTVIDRPERPTLMLALVRTLATAFPVVEAWVDVEQAEAGGRMTALLLASERPSGVNVLEDAATGRRWARWPDSELEAARAALAPPLLTDDYTPVDRLMLPVLAEDL